MATLLERLKETLNAHSERLRNRPFLEATMASAALVACADGDVSLSERIRVDQVMERLDQLKIYDPHLGVTLFNEVVDAYAADPEKGRVLAFGRIDKIAKDPEAAQLMIRICCAISEADGEFSLSEKRMINAICGTLGIVFEPGQV